MLTEQDTHESTPDKTKPKAPITADALSHPAGCQSEPGALAWMNCRRGAPLNPDDSVVDGTVRWNKAKTSLTGHGPRHVQSDKGLDF